MKTFLDLIGKTKYITPTWQDLQNYIFDIALQIKKQKRNFDRIVTLAKGGWSMSRSLVDLLGVKEVASIGVKFYCGVGERCDKPIIYQKLPIDITGEKILLFDDVADSGESLLFVKDYLHSLGIENIKTATIFYKPHSKIKPDFFAARTDDWIIFPYEVRETMTLLTPQWQKKGMADTEIRRRFIDFGFAKEQVDWFMKSV